MAKGSNFFEDRNKRYIMMAVIMVPVVVIMLFLGFRIYKDAKGILSLVKGDGTEVVVNDDHKISSMNYVLREGETQLQMDLFTQLKDAVEGKVESTPEMIAELVVKNHVADFYTWSNKLGQYDVGGMYYIPDYSRETVYLQARDTFYQYLNEYMNKYGVENLLEVESVEATAVKADNFDYKQIVKYYNLEDDDDYNEYTREDIHTYEAYDVTCSWTYVQGKSFSTSKYPTSMKFKVVYNTDYNRYEIVMCGDELVVTEVNENADEVSENAEEVSENTEVTE